MTLMYFSESFLRRCDPLIIIGCRLHDMLSEYITHHLKGVKSGLLIVAHLSLLGLLFPQYSKTFGSAAEYLLLFMLLVSPLSKLFRMKLLYQVMGLRRELGIWFAYLAIVHSVGYMSNPDWFGVFIAPHLSEPAAILPRYIFGIIALVLTLPLLITSNALSLRLLRGNWKRVHFLVYPLFATMLLHIFLPRNAGMESDLIGWIQFILAFGGYVLLKILAKRNVITPLREVIDFVGKRYRDYQEEKRSLPNTASF